MSAAASGADAENVPSGGPLKMQRAYVIGSPIAHSLSPAIHNAAFAALGIDASYEAVEVLPADLGDWVARIRGEGLLGFSVTIPHKERIVAYLDQVEGDAQHIGAVSAVVVSRPGSHPGTMPGALVGTSTDVPGFRRSLWEEARITLQGQRVLLVGAGGAARAIALVGLQDGAGQLWIANRHEDRAQALMADLAPRGPETATEALPLVGERIREVLRQATVVVNATSVGLRSQESPLDLTGIKPGTLVVDAVYNPLQTAFLQAAAELGARTLGGLGMLVYQAAVAFEAWTNQPAPIDVMRQAAERELAMSGASRGPTPEGNRQSLPLRRN